MYIFIYDLFMYLMVISTDSGLVIVISIDLHVWMSQYMSVVFISIFNFLHVKDYTFIGIWCIDDIPLPFY